MIHNHFDGLSKYLDLYSSHYEIAVSFGDFNVGIDENHMK